jgi:hypothetical protein
MSPNLDCVYGNELELAKEEIQSAWTEIDRADRLTEAKRRQATLLWLLSINAVRVLPARQLHALELCR